MPKYTYIHLKTTRKQQQQDAADHWKEQKKCSSHLRVFHLVRKTGQLDYSPGILRCENFPEARLSTLSTSVTTIAQLWGSSLLSNE